MTRALTEQIAMINQAAFLEVRGAVLEVRGLALRVADLPVPVGAMVSVAVGRGSEAAIAGQVIGFDQQMTLVMPLGTTAGIRRGDKVTAQQTSAFVRVGDSLLGRVLDGLGRPIDGKGPLFDTVPRPGLPAARPAGPPLDRQAPGHRRSRHGCAPERGAWAAVGHFRRPRGG